MCPSTLTLLGEVGLEPYIIMFRAGAQLPGLQTPCLAPIRATLSKKHVTEADANRPSARTPQMLPAGMVRVCWLRESGISKPANLPPHRPHTPPRRPHTHTCASSPTPTPTPDCTERCCCGNKQDIVAPRMWSQHS